MDKKRKIEMFVIAGACVGLLITAFFHGEIHKIGMEMSAITLAHLLASEVL